MGGIFLSWEIFVLQNYATVTSFYLITVGSKNIVKYFADNLSLVGLVFSYYLCKKIRWNLLEDQADPEKKQEKQKIMQSYDKD